MQARLYQFSVRNILASIDESLFKRRASIDVQIARVKSGVKDPVNLCENTCVRSGSRMSAHSRFKNLPSPLAQFNWYYLSKAIASTEHTLREIANDCLVQFPLASFGSILAE